jgi:hypothetical protein
MAHSNFDEQLVPLPARIVEKAGRQEVRTPIRNRLVGVFNDKNQLVIKRGDEFVVVEVPKA